MRAISAPPSRPEQLIRIPWAPKRIADCTARFIARRNATRRSNCCAMPSAINFASISGLRISTMLRLTSLLVTLAISPRSLSISAPFLPVPPSRPAAAPGMKPLQDKSTPDCRLSDIEPVDIELVVVLGIGDRRLQYLPHILRDAAAREGQFGDRLRGVLAADHLRDQVQLAR